VEVSFWALQPTGSKMVLIDAVKFVYVSVRRSWVRFMMYSLVRDQLVAENLVLEWSFGASPSAWDPQMVLRKTCTGVNQNVSCLPMRLWHIHLDFITSVHFSHLPTLSCT